jgi:hypothetical protein
MVLSVILISGCTQNGGTVPSGGNNVVCGNGIIESDEECDGTGCTSPEICENCECVTLQPPPLPD